jgi:predicted O-methyltransferase YrrM
MVLRQFYIPMRQPAGGTQRDFVSCERRDQIIECDFRPSTGNDWSQDLRAKTLLIGTAIAGTLAFVGIGVVAIGFTSTTASTSLMTPVLITLVLIAVTFALAGAAVLVGIRGIQHDLRLVRNRSKKAAGLVRELDVVAEQVSALKQQVAALDRESHHRGKAHEARILERIGRSETVQIDAAARLAAATLEQVLSTAASVDTSAEHLRSAIERTTEDTRKLLEEHNPAPVTSEVLGLKLLNEYKQLEALISLYARLRPSTELPPFRDWAISPDLGRRIVELIIQERPTHVLEVGCGTSTVIAAQAMKSIGHGHLTSLEQDARFADITIRMLEDRGLESWATIIHAPLVDTAIGSETWKWHDLSSAELPSRIDLLIVDGPPGSTGHFARYPAVPLLKDRMSPEAAVILDDTLRPEDAAVVERWLSESFDLRLVTVHRYDKGSTELQRNRV